MFKTMSFYHYHLLVLKSSGQVNIQSKHIKQLIVLFRHPAWIKKKMSLEHTSHHRSPTVYPLRSVGGIPASLLPTRSPCALCDTMSLFIYFGSSGAHA